MATDATGSIGRIDATAYPILDPENIIGKICPPRHPVFKQTAVMHNFKIPERSSIQKINGSIQQLILLIDVPLKIMCTEEKFPQFLIKYHR